ncbi:MAG: hypothetical protein HY820_06115 [Acidobacteria bacterium]|nr:hypothetical protein [Acidobacteriota bacterium]
MLNEEYNWSDVRYQISRRTSYDVSLSFDDIPTKEELPSGAILYRLDFPIVSAIFMKVWWMKESAFHRIFDRAGTTPSDLRKEWQNSLALRRPQKGREGALGGRTGEAAPRTQVLVIVTTRPVFAWVGLASPLFHKSGGEEQVYLPNLAHGAGPDHSHHARLLRTYTLPAI